MVLCGICYSSSDDIVVLTELFSASSLLVIPDIAHANLNIPTTIAAAVTISITSIT